MESEQQTEIEVVSDQKNETASEPVLKEHSVNGSPDAKHGSEEVEEKSLDTCEAVINGENLSEMQSSGDSEVSKLPSFAIKPLSNGSTEDTGVDVDKPQPINTEKRESPKLKLASPMLNDSESETDVANSGNCVSETDVANSGNCVSETDVANSGNCVSETDVANSGNCISETDVANSGNCVSEVEAFNSMQTDFTEACNSMQADSTVYKPQASDVTENEQSQVEPVSLPGTSGNSVRLILNRCDYSKQPHRYFVKRRPPIRPDLKFDDCFTYGKRKFSAVSQASKKPKMESEDDNGSDNLSNGTSPSLWEKVCNIM